MVVDKKLKLDYWRTQVMRQCYEHSMVPKNSSQRYREVSSSPLPNDLFQKMVKVTSGSNEGLYSILLSTFAVLLYKWFGQSSHCLAGGARSTDSARSNGMNFSSVSFAPVDRLQQVIEETYSAIHIQSPFSDIPQPELEDLWRMTLDSGSSTLNFGVIFEPFHVAFPQYLHVRHLLYITASENSMLISYHVKEGHEAVWDQYVVEHFQELLKKFFSNVESTVAELDCMPDNLQTRIMSFSKGPEVFYNMEDYLQGFRQVVSRFKNSTAVSCENINLTYEDLHRLSDALATLLQSQYQVTSGSRVAILMEHNEWLPVSVLGVLKCGAAFVPISPQFPRARIESITQDAGIHVVVSDSVTYPIALGLCDSIVAVDIQVPTDDAEPSRLAQPEVDPKRLAYILYTSGTTGKPKGVAITMESLCNYIAWSNAHYFADGSGKVFGWFTPLHFDLSMTGLLGTLMRGDELRIYSATEPGSALINIFQLSGDVTCTKVTPSHLTLLSGLIKPGTNSNKIQTLIVGGETLSTNQILTAEKFSPGVKVYNEYGPTEATIGCSVANVVSGKPVTIGKAIANTSLFILNKDLQLLPPGVPGEIYISGKCLAAGYWADPQRSNEKFVSPPKLDKSYRSGDIACWLQSGEIEYIGRGDNQVKIRGHRIEIDEIISVLEAHAAVSAAHIHLQQLDDRSTKRLICFYVGETSADELPTLASRYLPDYMVPETFIKLDSFPLTHNGKLDAPRLLQYADSPVQMEEPDPVDEIEKVLLGVVKIILDKSSVGIHTSFFKAGGDSIKAIQLVAKVTAELGLKIDIKDIFDYPTVASLASYLRQGHITARLEVSILEEQNSYPASKAQHRLWALDQFQKGQIAYNQNNATIVTGALNIEACCRAFQFVIKRHESLRATFHYHAGELRFLVQDFDPSIHSLKYYDYRSVENKERDVNNLVEAASKRPFNLSKGPLIRGEMYQVYDDKFVILLSTHHIISDGWSWGLIREELALAYQALSVEEEPALPPIKYQFKEYAQMLRAWEQSDGFNSSRKYWSEILHQPLPVLALPISKPRPPVQTFNGHALELSLTPEQADELRKLSHECEATIFMVLVSLVSLLLSKYTSQRDIILGTDAASRTREEFDRTVGFFLDSIVLRTQIDPSASFAQLVKNVKKVILGAFTHQQYPFDNLLEDLGIQRDLSRTPIFDVLVIMQVKPTIQLEKSADQTIDGHSTLSSETFPLATTTSLVDLEINFTESSRGIGVAVRYNTDLFDDHQVQRLMTSFLALVEQVIERPDLPMIKFPLLLKPQNEQILKFSSGRRRLNPTADFISLFREQLAQHGDHIALIMGEEMMTYSMLDQVTNQLASYLIANYNIQPESNLGICMKGGVGAVVAMIAIMKMRCTFVAIDPALPKNRITNMVSDSRITYVLYEDETTLEHQNIEAVFIRDARTHQNIQMPPEAERDTNRPAYIIYTSGTTGQPKGVSIPSSAFVDYLITFSTLFKLAAKDRIIHQSSISFDTSVEEIFPALTCGATVVVIEEARRKDVDSLLATILAYAVDVLSVTPSVINELKGDVNKLRRLKALISGGESLSSAQYGDLWMNDNLFNTYGPCETTVCATYHKIEGPNDSNVIGQPMENHAVYVLSDELHLLPEGVSGEIFIAGAGLSSGYLNLPELTEHKFFVSPELGRLYRTGDRGRYRDGKLIFEGRNDEQVKLNGYRIELGEIVHALRSINTIQDAFVMIDQIPERPTQIVAFLETSQLVDTDEIVEKLKTRIPIYMIPTEYFPVAKLPTSYAGKVDKRALSEIIRNRKTPLTDETTLTESEEWMLQLWKEILMIDQIGVQQNFFSIGGHSLKATKLCNEIAQRLGVRLTLPDVFENSSVRKLCERLEELRELAASPKGMEIEI